jgi:mono/diheme cytochrome c family protein
MSASKRAIVLLSAAALIALGLGGCPTATPTGLTGDPTVGLTLFETECIGCHPTSAGLNPNAVTNNLGTVNPAMIGITLTDQQVADVQAYLATP